MQAASAELSQILSPLLVAISPLVFSSIVPEGLLKCVCFSGAGLQVECGDVLGHFLV